MIPESKLLQIFKKNIYNNLTYNRLNFIKLENIIFLQNLLIKYSSVYAQLLLRL
jgi:hypothetical protein